MTDHELRANDLANALTLMVPGYLRQGLEASSPEELDAVDRILQRARLSQQMALDSDPFRAAKRKIQAEQEGLP